MPSGLVGWRVGARAVTSMDRAGLASGHGSELVAVLADAAGFPALQALHRSRKLHQQYCLARRVSHRVPGPLPGLPGTQGFPPPPLGRDHRAGLCPGHDRARFTRPQGRGEGLQSTRTPGSRSSEGCRSHLRQTNHPACGLSLLGSMEGGRGDEGLSL